MSRVNFIITIFCCFYCLLDVHAFNFDNTTYQGPVESKAESILGVPIRNYKVYNDVVAKDQYLADILQACSVDYAEIYQLAHYSNENGFNVAGIKSGRPYTILCSPGDASEAEFMIYEADPVSYVIFDLREKPNVLVKQKSVRKEVKNASGIIESSLYLTLDHQDLSPRIAIQLSEIYAWTIDFFRIQKGDRFKVIYEDKYADGEYIGIGEILYASFTHFGEEELAFNFRKEETEQLLYYYNEEGTSLRRAFLRAPVKYSRISSRFSGKRFHPVLKRNKAHLGTDYAAPKGTPIFATANGKITASTYNKNNGNYVKIKHNGTYTTQYLHMSKRGKDIKKGKYVNQGDVIGYVGSTGLATGPHVCYRFWKHGRQVDPFKEDFPAAEPLEEAYLPRLKNLVDSIKPLLDGIPYPAISSDSEDFVMGPNEE